MEDKEKLFSYLHRPEDEQLARRILDYIEAALKHETLQVSDFLNPHEQKLACQLVSQFLELHYILDGGIEPSEQKIILIGPDFMDLKGEEKVNLYKGFWNGTFSHRDILGSVLSLGVQRKKIGDIFFTEDAFYIAVKAELGEFSSILSCGYPSFNICLRAPTLLFFFVRIVDTSIIYDDCLFVTFVLKV